MTKKHAIYVCRGGNPTVWLGLTIVLASAAACWGFNIDSKINYGQLNAPHVTYSNVTETSSTDSFGVDDAGHFGIPTLEGDSLTFDTPSFAAQAYSGNGFDMTDGFLSFEMQAAPNSSVNQIRLQQFGSISLVSAFGGSAGTLVNTDASVFLTIYEVLVDDGTPGGLLYTLPGTVTLIGEMAVTPDRASPPGWDSLDDAEVTNWQGGMTVDILEGLKEFDAGLTNGMPIIGATRMKYKLKDMLIAMADDGGTSAFIDDTGVLIEPIIETVPEPVAIALIAPLGLLAGWVRRRRP